MPESAHSLSIVPWMTAPAVSRLFEALGAPNTDVRFVGGCVRNLVMGIEVSEIDIATPDEPQKVIELLSRANLKCVPTGLSHGTVTAIIEDTSFEITSLRKDTACDGRHAAVEFTSDWEEDAGRRDFTFNAMSLRPNGDVFDYHAGLADAKEGQVRFVGNAADRIQEDFLRILRLFRFQAWYGRVPIEPGTIAACQKYADGIEKLSGERLQQELSKLLIAPDPSGAVDTMHACGVLAKIIPGGGNIAALKRLIQFEAHASDFPYDWLRRLAAMIGMESVSQLAGRLKLSNASSRRLQLLKTECTQTDFKERNLQRQFYKIGPLLTLERALLMNSVDSAEDSGLIAAIAAAAAAWTPRDFPIGGDDVLALGAPHGPQIGQVLAELEDLWIASGFRKNREDLLAEARRRISQVQT